MQRRSILKAAAAGAATLGAPRVFAQVWPSGPIRIVVPFPPGGSTDAVARLAAPGLQQSLGVPIVVENRGGAGGTVAAEHVAKSAKDGYTTLMMSNAHVVAPAMYKSLRFDAVKDFQMVSMVGTAGLMLVTRPDFPAKDLKGLIAHAKANPRQNHRHRSGENDLQK